MEPEKKYNLVCIGSGPAGLMAAIEGYRKGRKILILERMDRPALKLRMSGKGRCNITNAAPYDEFISHFGKNGRFLKYAFNNFFNTELLRYFENLNISFKLERGGRYFPQNDKAMDIVYALLHQINSRKISLITGAHVHHIRHEDDETFTICAHINRQDKNIRTEKVVLATGGKSYPGTGSNGSGYDLARHLGHTITPVYPSLVPLITAEMTAQRLQGLSLKNVAVSVFSAGKRTDRQFGEMLFTDYGVSGPVILSLSRNIVGLLREKKDVYLYIDLKPALDMKLLDARLLREISANGKQSFNTLLKRLLPKKMIPVFIDQLNIPGDKQLSTISSLERKRLKLLLKEFTLQVIGHKSYNEAIITRGGVSIKEINPNTMESKIIKNLFFAGEVIDIDADTGGYNLQAAFSTGWLAGKSSRNELYQV